MLYPLKFTPILKETLWGGDKLAYKSKDGAVKSTIGESWEISSVEDHISVVSEGPLEGNNLEELIEVYMGDLVGDHIYEKFGIEFPLLIKYIDACDDLSIQVHPDDKTAKERHNAYGKTEMWYIVEADKGAQLIMGFNKDTDRAEYLSRLNNETLPDILNVEQVKKGDCFFIPSGTVHAIKKGCLIAEIQQTSDVTYRIYDYHRKDKNGEYRELHTELATDVIDYKRQEEHAIPYANHLNHPEELVTSEYFTTKHIRFNTEIERDYFSIDSFVIYMCLEGNCTIVYDTDKFVKAKKGETVLIPAVLKQISLIPDRETTLLEVFVG
ncbi:class I mannose-6-phosphate isomerase [Porphyromonadaceae bacterium OttesenSCG-928-L07]|nr:class I mannose-6-phosphate isomerase [Porphyromonadaceae bacterium OttesenSCG-928-L07]MDL2252211.1 class I mannose-6-phosphate isomerase [Odoribacter sp. OttesenSCG-928-J03]